MHHRVQRLPIAPQVRKRIRIQKMARPGSTGGGGSTFISNNGSSSGSDASSAVSMVMVVLLYLPM